MCLLVQLPRPSAVRPSAFSFFLIKIAFTSAVSALLPAVQTHDTPFRA
jgi:hypothetical protein